VWKYTAKKEEASFVWVWNAWWIHWAWFGFGDAFDLIGHHDVLAGKKDSVRRFAYTSSG
jgi:hypothetical protein